MSQNSIVLLLIREGPRVPHPACLPRFGQCSLYQWPTSTGRSFGNTLPAGKHSQAWSDMVDLCMETELTYLAICKAEKPQWRRYMNRVDGHEGVKYNHCTLGVPPMKESRLYHHLRRYHVTQWLACECRMQQILCTSTKQIKNDECALPIEWLKCTQNALENPYSMYSLKNIFITLCNARRAAHFSNMIIMQWLEISMMNKILSP